MTDMGDDKVLRMILDRIDRLEDKVSGMEERAAAKEREYILDPNRPSARSGDNLTYGNMKLRPLHLRQLDKDV